MSFYTQCVYTVYKYQGRISMVECFLLLNDKCSLQIDLLPRDLLSFRYCSQSASEYRFSVSLTDLLVSQKKKKKLRHQQICFSFLQKEYPADNSLSFSVLKFIVAKQKLCHDKKNCSSITLTKQGYSCYHKTVFL